MNQRLEDARHAAMLAHEARWTLLPLEDDDPPNIERGSE